MRKDDNSTFKSRVYTDRPAYADFEAPAKFEAIKSIIAKRLLEHPNAVCSYSGGSDSDILNHKLGMMSIAYINEGLAWEKVK